MHGKTQQPNQTSPRVDLTAILEVLKSVGLVVGGIGGVAILFFWIGNAIIVARLRAYNLYGVVHYTDEYVTEAGFQFFQDIFTFFQDWRLIPFFVILMALLLLTVPVGGGSQVNERTATSGEGRISRSVALILRYRINYIIFLTLALSAAFILTSGWFVRKLSSDIVCQERVLADLSRDLGGMVLILLPRKGALERADEFQQRFYEELTFGVEPTLHWMNYALAEISRREGTPLSLEVFQKRFSIREPSPFRSDADFEKSETYVALRNVWLSHALQQRLKERVNLTLQDFRSLLSGHLTSEGDTSSLVLIPANYELAGESMRRLTRLRENISAFFVPGDEDTSRICTSLGSLKPIAFGQFMISYSFWVLIGILVYLLLNSTRLIRLPLWEGGYFVVIFLLFLTVLITLPTAYGRFKFEFKVQRLKDIVFTGEDKGVHPLRKKLDEARQRGAELYILGPTKGREIIIGAFEHPEEADAGSTRIIMLERSAYSYMSVEPVRPEKIPGIIRLLRQQAGTTKQENVVLAAERGGDGPP